MRRTDELNVIEIDGIRCCRGHAIPFGATMLEGNGPTLNYRGIDNRTYYLLDGNGGYVNYSGCGNTVNCNNAIVREHILDCLR